jgi:2-aminoadipate transaminase
MKRYDFDGGLPDSTAYPVQDLRRYFDRVLEQDVPGTLDYTSASIGVDGLRGGPSGNDMIYGHWGLRHAIAQWMGRTEDVTVREDDVLLASGSMNGISMTVNALVGPGDAAVVEAVSYPYARVFMEQAGCRVFTVPVDENGMDVEQIAGRFAEARDAGLRPRMLYTVSTFHSPTGTVLTMDRRRRLIELGREWDVTILDDSCYYHLYYGKPPPPTLLSLAAEGPVVQSSTFSKYIAPGLRMAWLTGRADLIATIADRRQDFAVNQVTARVIEGFVRDGRLDEHLVVLRDLYRTKRDVAAAALEKHCAPLVRFTLPEGGFYFWLEVDDRVNYDRAMARADELGVRFRPGVRFLNEDTGTRHLRVSVAPCPIADIEPGIELLGAALADSLVRVS